MALRKCGRSMVTMNILEKNELEEKKIIMKSIKKKKRFYNTHVEEMKAKKIKVVKTLLKVAKDASNLLSTNDEDEAKNYNNALIK